MLKLGTTQRGPCGGLRGEIDKGDTDMSEKRYPTRMHEVLGVETGERFTINEEDFGFVFRLNEDGYLMFDDHRANNEYRITYDLIHLAINHGIIRKPRLSEEVNPDSHQYVDNDSTNRRKSVKQKCRNLHSAPQPDPDTGLVPCGCGGRPYIEQDDDYYMGGWSVDCPECEMWVPCFKDKDTLVKTWNTAMGWKGGAE